MKKIIFLLGIIFLLISFSCSEKKEYTKNESLTLPNQNTIGIYIPNIEMISLPSTQFTMGSTSGDADESPSHIVILTKGILMGKYEITNAQVASVYTWGLINGHLEVNEKTVVNTRGEAKELIDIDYPGCQIQYIDNHFSVLDGFKNHPSSLITWYGTVLFCNLLSMMEGKSPVYNLTDWSCSWDMNGYRLPTEAEWEFAARGGTKSKGFIYSGSNDPDEVAWFVNNSEAKAHPVGLKTPNELGFHDMSGNVWECCWDYYGYYIPEIINKDVFESELLTKIEQPDQKEYIQRIYIENNETKEYKISPELTNEENRKTWELFRAIGFKMGPQTNPMGIRYRNKRVLRGGDWGTKEFYLRNTYRGRVFAQVSSLAYGFRVVRAIGNQ